MRVMLAMPSGGRVLDHTVMCLVDIATTTKLHSVQIYRDTYCDRGHNEIVQGALDLGADAIMFVDSDQEVPGNVIDRLAAHKKAIVGAAYRMRQPPFQLMPDSTGTETGLREVPWLPSGVMLVRIGVFEKIPYPWFPNLYGKNTKEFVGSDRSFSRKAKFHGFPLFCDYDVSREVTHTTELAMTFDGEFIPPGTIARNKP